jgi:NTP pyrophosphatase (non-canonical NTP hydrolase)
MDMRYYQRKTGETAFYPRDAKTALCYLSLGLCGESGEVAEKLKKIIRDSDSEMELSAEQKQNIAKELGDVLWYVAQLSGQLGFDLGEIAEMNLQKLRDRQSRNRLSGDGDNR